LRQLKIVIFERTAQNRSEIDFIRDQLAPGLSNLGDEVEISAANYVECDIAVIMWSPRGGWPERARAARAIRNLHGSNLLIVENPIFRGLAQRCFRVGFDHVHRAGKFFRKDMPDDRARAMGLKPAPWKEGDGAVFVAGQLPGDYSLDGLDISEWVVDVATHVERTTARPLIIRPHPLDVYTNWHMIQSSLGVEVSREPLQVDLARAGTWITLTSGSAIDAVIAGVPTICLNIHNFAWDASAHSLRGIEAPWRGERAQWLANLAYVQWTREEIEQGQCWRHLRELRERRA
jgi:hypothetical protein